MMNNGSSTYYLEFNRSNSRPHLPQAQEYPCPCKQAVIHTPIPVVITHYALFPFIFSASRPTKPEEAPRSNLSYQAP